MKKNVLDWVCGTMTDATSAIVLTHNIDFLFLQSILRPRLRNCGHPRLTIFADAACAAGSYRQQWRFIADLGHRYRVVPVDMGVGRRFHPKALLLSGPTKAALAVGSGNATHGGWSANHEIWATYESDDDGMSALSAFRHYLQSVLGLVHQTESVAEEVLAPFNSNANSWAGALPEPAGLFGTPGDGPLIDRIVESAGEDVVDAVYCAPYFDPDGEALGELARRVPVPTTTLLQLGNVGLPASAIETIPANVALRSTDTNPSRFIHAKLFVLRRSHLTCLVAGSANISRAALMANGTWGNAELVAVQEVSHEQAKELLGDLMILDEEPTFPETAPSGEWEIQTTPLRVLAAWFMDGVLEFTFKSDSPFRDITVETNDGLTKTAIVATNSKLARVELSRCPTSIRLRCTLDDGQAIASERAWVDNEASLGVSAPQRRIIAKLTHASESGGLSVKGYFEIIELLHQHIRQPERYTRGSSSARKKGPSSPPPIYSVADIFSEGFGRPQTYTTTQVPLGFREMDFLGAFTAYFTLSHLAENKGDETPIPSDPENDPGENTNSDEIQDSEGKEALLAQQAKRQRTQASKRLRNRLTKALESVVTAMSTDEFVDGRSPERLGADIAATALLLSKGLSDEIISEEDFSSVTDRLWTVLFFGTKNNPGLIPKLAASVSPESSDSFKSAMASPRLSAALTLWCFPDWGRDTTDSIKFRFSTMLLAAKLPWLLHGGTREAVEGELRRLARAIPTGVQFDRLMAAWAAWTRAGKAFEEFESAAKVWSARDLAAAIADNEVSQGDLLWQGGQLCVVDADCRRDQTDFAKVYFLRGGTTQFQKNWLVPVASLLQAPNLLDLRQEVRTLLLRILAEVKNVAQSMIDPMD